MWCCAARSGRTLGRQDPDHAEKPRRRLLRRDRCRAQDRRHRARRRHRRGGACDDGRHQRGDRAQGAAHRAAGDRRLPRHPDDPRRASLRDVRSADRVSRAADLARHDLRRRRARAGDRRGASSQSMRSRSRRSSTNSSARASVSVAVSLLNAYLNPGERARHARHRFCKRAPELYVSISSDVAPQIREYPRTSTVAMNAYTTPITGPYLDALRAG